MKMSDAMPVAEPSSSRWIDMAAIMAVNDLQWRAKTIVAGFNKGIHRSPKHGFSVEFSEFRPFSHGDDLRAVDWKLFARTDRLYIKRFEDETNRRCLVVVDQSSSMQYSTTSISKSEYANTLAATLAYSWLQQRDAVGAITFDDEIHSIIPAKYRPGQLKRILASLDRTAEVRKTDLLKPLTQVANWNHRKSLVIVISDFLTPSAALKESLSRLKARKHEVVLVQVLDPGELSWQSEVPVMVKDMESATEIFVDPLQSASAYRDRFKEHQQSWQSLADSLGIRWLPVTTQLTMDQLLRILLKG